MKMLKKLIPAMIFCLLLCSCDADPYRGLRPVEFPQAKWVCVDYGISFSIEEKYEVSDAKMLMNGEKIPFTFLWSSFDNSVNIHFEVDGEADSLSGKCEFGKEEFTITIEDAKGYYPDEQVILKFIRVA